MKRTGPIKPGQVGRAKLTYFPPAVFEAFNELIAQHMVGGSATVRQCDVVERMISKGLSEDEIYAKGWLNVEATYEAAGWIVLYDRPGYCESYEPTFTFEV